MPANRSRPRLVLADDRGDVLDEIRELLASEFDILREVNQGSALVEAAIELQPDAVISDVRMPGIGGIDAGAQILRVGACSAVIVLTMYNEPHLVTKAIAAGIRGYVLKVDAGEELIPAVYEVLGGGRYLSQGVRSKWKE
jgi:DNA-binding NarL/FixJ family response regulator